MRKNSALTSSLIAAALCSVLGAAHAADWHVVSTDRGKTIEIDRDSVLRAESGKKVAWGRLVLSDADAQKTGYAMVQALNRYDCQSLRFATIKRVYLDANHKILREERAGSDSDIALLPGTLDEKLFREVCQPPGAEELRQVAEQAGRAAQTAANAAEGQGGIQRTEMVSIKPDLRDAAAQARSEMAAAPKTAAPKADTGEKLTSTAGLKEKLAAADTPASVKSIEPVAPAAKPAPPVMRSEIPLPTPYRPKPKPVQMATLAPAAQVAPRSKVKVAAEEAPRPVAHDDNHWAYEGEFGPQNWGKLKPEWAQCSEGRTQSPIDIREGIKVDLPPISFDYKTSYFTIIDNGHTVQVNVGEGSSFTVSGKRYDLVQFHFHKPAEERINGKSYEMVAHLVHRDVDNKLAVVAVLLDRGDESSIFNTLWAYLPLQKNVESTPDVSIDLAKLLPEKREYFTYMGSLTTPPCSEGVTWIVLKQPHLVSAEQIGVFGHLYRNNARPVQAANSRLIKQSR
ncbi:carbonic anhydrase [Methyloversatilis sp.]|uniref:carbonic anhydrase n=1 Tax=Methyloversatilis sp. TaxID=2569862 RepID=UPI002734B4ED|nr:carbonic anhydrase family protein [Methyloversatilis sp.]MDP2868865.1 carbonic anhydrase family protein [Methyloversatilis sp.]MDP3457474.1 carbonic anhydrase family protein [Methyloversatilis sp.]MDP3579333.1 carbonic anhydrase family protein [Methyloversatilis sp.]